MNYSYLCKSYFRKENRMKRLHRKWLSASLAAVVAVSSACAAGVTAFAGFGKDYISTEPEIMQTLFDGLCEGIVDIAAGKRTSSVIKVDLPTDIPFDSTVDIHENCPILEAILVEYPYELFWFDFTETGGLQYYYYYNDTPDGQEYLTAVEYKLSFAQAAKAAENAKAIVEEKKDKSDFEKLTAYKNKI